MTKMQSRGEFRVHVSIGGPVGERVIPINVGDVVDFDEVVIPARPGRQQMTLAQALGTHAEYFDAVVDEAQAASVAAPEPQTTQAAQPQQEA